MPNQTRLTASQTKPYRDNLLAKQAGRCRLCGDKVAKGEEVLDHDHKTGRCRGVLHRGCNAMLGHIENNMPRHKLTNTGRLARFLAGVVQYISDDYSDRPFHSTHRTEEEKRLKRNAKARKARAKAKEKA